VAGDAVASTTVYDGRETIWIASEIKSTAATNTDTNTNTYANINTDIHDAGKSTNPAASAAFWKLMSDEAGRASPHNVSSHDFADCTVFLPAGSGREVVRCSFCIMDFCIRCAMDSANTAKTVRR
jgi:hypothetical protein